MVERSRVRGTYRFVTLSIIVPLACIAGLKPAKGAPASQPAQAPPSASGRVIDDRTGLPVAEFTVTFGDEGSIPYWQHSNARRFGNGTFDYDLPPYFDGKEYRIQVRAKGYKAAASRVMRRTETAVKLEFRLVPPDRFAARVILPDGRPAAGAAMRVVTPGEYLRVS
ncbi:MAG TPA: hypothetical protein VH475_26665, partial [Tepidisphaeraceae bacterium]